MQLRHVLAVVDFSTDAGLHAAWRAAHLAWAHQAELCLLSLVALDDTRPSSRFGATAAPARTRADLLHLAGEIRDALGVIPAVVVGVGDEGPALLRACARRTDLVILSEATSAARRLLAGHGVPLLLARRASGHAHRSAMVVHEPGVSALPSLLGAAQWLCKPEGIHALRLMDRRLARHLQAADQPVSHIQALGHLAEQRTLAGLQDELARSGLRPAQARVLVGASAQQLAHQQRRLGATVLVLGHQPRPMWQEWLWPGLAQQLGARVDCDVLQVPARLPTVREARWALRPALQGSMARRGRRNETAR